MSRSLRLVAFCLTLLAVVALFQSASAQAPKQRGPRPMFGFGAMGGFAQPPGAMWGMLLRIEAVQKDLELTDGQKTELKEIADKQMAKMRENMPSKEAFQEFQKLTPEQKEARFAQFRKNAEARAEEFKAQIEKVLMPDQIERLRQIAIQIRGVRALEDQEVQSELGLTQEQKDKMKAIRELGMRKGRELFAPKGEQGRPDMREAFQAMQKLQKELNQQVMDVLTPEQKQRFTEMQGKKIDLDFSQLMRGPGFGKRPPSQEKPE